MKLEQNENGITFDLRDIHPNDLHLIDVTIAFALEILDKTPLDEVFYDSEKNKIFNNLSEIKNQLYRINNQAESLVQSTFNKVTLKIYSAD